MSDDELYRQYETINLYRRGPGAKVELNRPERMNAWNRQFSADLLEVITEVTENPEVRAVLITGAGRARLARPGWVAAVPPARSRAGG